MVGIFASLLAFLGLGGCTGDPEHPTNTPSIYNSDGTPRPEILDGPGMYFDPKSEYINKSWTDPESGQTLFFTEDTLTLKDGDQTVWNGAWEIELIDGYMYGAQGKNGEPVGDYAYFLTDYYTLPENSPANRSYLAAYRTGRNSDDEYTLFQYDEQMKIRHDE